MNCLKCGAEISEDEVFCMDCLVDAQRYPVDPAAAVYLPRREKAEVPKKTVRRRVLTSEEQIRVLRRRLRLQAVALVLFAAIALAISYPAFSYLTKNHRRPGQNYSAMTTPATQPPAATLPPVTAAP